MVGLVICVKTKFGVPLTTVPKLGKKGIFRNCVSPGPYAMGQYLVMKLGAIVESLVYISLK